MELLQSFPPLTWAIIAVIAALLIYFHGPVYSAHTANYSPSILTSIGIFGTFLGVALGLNEFDTQSVENSVPALLEGLKTAFWTSIAGLLGALSIKFRYAVASMRVRAHREAKQTATIDDLAWHLEKIANAVSQEGSDNWLVWRDQQAIKAEVQHKKLLDTLNGYQDKMTEANREALEQAITHVMREFNTRIEDQYGDNFKRLNESVGQMMEWQANYKDQIEDLMSANERYAQSSKTAAESFEKLISQTSSFTSVAEDMETLLNALQSQSENLREYLTTFTSLIVDAQQGLPQIENRILALTAGLQDLVKGQTEQMRTLLEATATGIRDTSQEVSQLLLEGTSKTQDKMGAQLDDLLNKNNAQFDRLEQSMEAELNKALTSFGYQLTSLSEKFVNDYIPLTDKLRDLVSAAEK
jgi:DNA anti-recombination protein RmuC